MNLSALGLVIFAAFIHAFWNFISKKSSGGALFVWCYTVAAVLVYSPMAAWLIYQGHMPTTPLAWGIIFLSSLLHLGYTVLLQRGYQVADLTVVYPIARGMGPLLSATGAYLLLGEKASVLSITGLLIIVAGIGVIAKLDQVFIHRHAHLLRGVKYGALIGIFIASYTLVDAYGIKFAFITPLLLDYFQNIIRSLMLAPNAWQHRKDVVILVKEKWMYALAVGTLSPLAYILILGAIKHAPVSLIAPAREMSMMIAALLGTFLLKEGDIGRRLAGAMLIVIGILCLAITR